MTQTSENEKRVYNRIDFDKSVTLAVNDQSRTGQLLDISLKGAMLHIETGEDINIDTPCVLTIALSDAEMIEMQATVVWARDQQLGLHCDSIDLDSITNLKRLLELNMADPSLLDRDLASLIQ